MACLPSIALIAPVLLVSLFMGVYGTFAHQIPYQECLQTALLHNTTAAFHLRQCQKGELLTWQSDPDCNPCAKEYDASMSA